MTKEKALQAIKELEQYIKSKDKTETAKIGIYAFEFGKKYDLSYDPYYLSSKITYFRNLGLSKVDFSHHSLEAMIKPISDDGGYLHDGYLNWIINFIYKSEGFSFDFSDCGFAVTVRKIKEKKL